MARVGSQSAWKHVTMCAGLIAVAPIVVSFVVLGAAVLLARSLFDTIARADLEQWWPGPRGG